MGACLLILAACTQSSTQDVHSTATLASLGGLTDTTASSTTLLSSQPTTGIEGYVVTVLDGHTFDIQPVRQGTTRLTLGYIVVPDIGTCEGEAARALLASLIAGKKVTVDAGGFVYLDDIDVALTMIQYGYAMPSTDAPGPYIEDSKQATPFNCANTTTTTINVIVVPLPTKAPKPKRTTTVAEETVPATDPPATPAPVETTPNAAPTPPTTPKRTEPAPTEAPVTEPDRTPREPATPRAPETPAPPNS